MKVALIFLHHAESEAAKAMAIAELQSYAAQCISDGMTPSNVNAALDVALNLVYKARKVADISNAVIEGKGIINPYNGHEYVDFGLPSGTKWATMNVGASSETDEGLYFMWADTEGYAKDSGYDFSYANYTAKGIYEKITADYDGDVYGFLKLEWDAARVNMGGQWHTPTPGDFYELINNSNIDEIQNYHNSGISGFILSSKINGNTLFLPKTGYFRGKNKIIPERACYFTDNYISGYGLVCYSFYNNSYRELNGSYVEGYTVRGVCK